MLECINIRMDTIKKSLEHILLFAYYKINKFLLLMGSLDTLLHYSPDHLYKV